MYYNKQSKPREAWLAGWLACLLAWPGKQAEVLGEKASKAKAAFVLTRGLAAE